MKPLKNIEIILILFSAFFFGSAYFLDGIINKVGFTIVGLYTLYVMLKLREWWNKWVINMTEIKEKLMTRKEIESQYSHYTSSEKAIISLLIEISDKIRIDRYKE